jgi:hypothetical protein
MRLNQIFGVGVGISRIGSATFAAVFCLAGLAAGCTNSAGVRKQPPMVEELSTKPAPRTGAVTTEVTFKKSEILDREFLYGADLQYSSMGDVEYSLILQVLAIGHFDARFRIIQAGQAGQAGSEARLQLVADQRAYFESDINHPERLIHEFKVLRQTAQTITIQIERGSAVLLSMLGTAEEGGQPASTRSSWVRSVQYEPQGNYLMFETSLEDSAGNVVEFMESLFPRETLVPPGTGEPETLLLNDPEREPLADRYRFLSNATVFLDMPSEGRIRTQVASRFAYHPVHAPGPITWHVTPNIPSQYLADIRTGVEAWNRYSQKLWGTDMVRFAGVLPDGVKVGDPRYNVISWDSVAEAGAAYESQAVDARTGLQSHSLIYLPNAWLNIGRKYWEQGDLSEPLSDASAAETLAREARVRKVLGRSLPVNCIQDAVAKLGLRARVDSETFARELLKGVLFHEVGHALGLGHNFKGSLSWNPEDPSSAFSTTIMDYNQYAIERHAFTDVDSADGTVLEYDRQILSVLYNDGAEVADTDPELPACDDAEADSTVGGIDPLCIRYDAGTDPTAQLAATLRLVTEPAARIGSTESLPVALDRLALELGDPSEVVDAEMAQIAVVMAAQKMMGVVNFYFVMGAQSLASIGRAGVKSLHEMRGKLPATLDAAAMRQRALDGVEWMLSLQAFPQATDQALDRMIASVSAWLLRTPAFAGVGDATDPRRVMLDALVEALRQIKSRMASNEEGSTLALLRGAILSALTRKEGAPYFFEISDAGMIDVEARVLAWLESAAIAKGAFSERLRALRSLKGFAGTEAGDSSLARVRDALKVELRSVRTARERDLIRKLLGVIPAAE